MEFDIAKILAMSKDEQEVWCAHPKYGNRDWGQSLEDLAFRLRDETQGLNEFRWACAEVYNAEYEHKPKQYEIHAPTMIVWIWLACQARPIHWILAALLAKEADKLLKKAKNTATWADKNQYIHQAISLLLQLCDWIPVSERLPDKDGNYYVVWDAPQKIGNKPFVSIGCLDWNMTRWREVGCPTSTREMYKVTHWRPITLPKPSCPDKEEFVAEVKQLREACSLLNNCNMGLSPKGEQRCR